ncbi:MAG: FAD-binding protein [Deltaproteobacteria bacterium]|nr:FAD-binding protein [Deltaproteobacteria bacterium]
MSNNEIWVYGDLRSERFFDFSLNILGKAKELARSIKATTAIVLLEGDGNISKAFDQSLSKSQAAKKYIQHGADNVYIIKNKNADVLRADSCAQTLSGIVLKRNPMLFCFTLTDFCRELAARTAKICETGLISECADIKMDNGAIVATCPSWGGRIMADITFADSKRTGFATVIPTIASPSNVKGSPGNIEEIDTPLKISSAGLKLLSRAPEEKELRSIEDAEIVVVGGAGMGTAQGFTALRELAIALSGQVGATRPPVLNHWVDENRLIGQTGKTIRPNLLISVGTSGAVQYTAGIDESKVIVAVNRDKKAPIFETADFGIIADAGTFVPVFTSLVKATVMRQLADDIDFSGKREAKAGFGSAIKKLREGMEWSFEKLAEATDQSPDFIEQVENDEVAPSVSFLLRMARVFKVDPGMFLGEEEKTAMRDRRSDAFAKRTENYSYKTLTPGAENEHLRAFMITIESGQDHKPVAYKHEGEEFVFVMDGKLELTLGDKPAVLKAGESKRFNSEIPHKLKSLSNELTRCLVILYTP